MSPVNIVRHGMQIVYTVRQGMSPMNIARHQVYISVNMYVYFLCGLVCMNPMPS